MFGPNLTPRTTQNLDIYPPKWAVRKESHMSIKWILFGMAFKLANGMEAAAHCSSCLSDSLFDLNWPPVSSTEDGFGHLEVDYSATKDEAAIDPSLLSLVPMEMDPVQIAPQLNSSPLSKEIQARGKSTSTFRKPCKDRFRSNQQKQLGVSKTKKLHAQTQTAFPRSVVHSDHFLSRNLLPCDQSNKDVEPDRGFDLNVNPSERFLDGTEKNKQAPFTENLREGRSALRIDGLDPEYDRMKNVSQAPRKLSFPWVHPSNAVTGERGVEEESQSSDNETNELDKLIGNGSTSETKSGLSCKLWQFKRNWQSASARSAPHVALGSKVNEIKIGRSATLTYFNDVRAKLSGCKCLGLHWDNACTLPKQTKNAKIMERFILVEKREAKSRKPPKEYYGYARKAHLLGSNQVNQLKLGDEIEDFVETLPYEQKDEEEKDAKHSLYSRRKTWMMSCIFMMIYDVKVVCVAFPQIVEKDIHTYQSEAWSIFKLAWRKFFSGSIENGVSCEAKTMGISPENLDEIVGYSAKQIFSKNCFKTRLTASRTLLQLWLMNASPTLYKLAKDPEKTVLRNPFIALLNAFQQHTELS